MAQINEQAILNKIKENQNIQNRIKVQASKKIKKKVAESFIKYMEQSILVAKGNGTIKEEQTASLLINSFYANNIYSDEKTGRISIHFSFLIDKFRYSVSPIKYRGIDNVVALLNNGYSHASGSIYGVWHKHYGESVKIKTPTSRAGAHFIGRALELFKQNEGSRFKIVSLGADSAYDKSVW